MEAMMHRPKESRQLPEGNYNIISLSDPKNLTRRIGGEYKPVVVAPGWGITLKTEEKFLKDMVEAGKDVNALDYSRIGGRVEEMGDGIRAETARKAEAYADYMHSLPEGKYDLFGQSEGTMVILAALIRHPDLLDKVGNVVFMSPAGLTDNDSFVKLLGRYVGGHVPQDFMHLLVNPLKHRNVVKMTNEATKYIGKNPVRALKEANTIAKGGFYDLLEGLNEKGISVAFIQGEDDKLTPAKALWEKVGEGYQSPWKELTQEDLNEDPKYKEAGKAVGDTVWDRDSKSKNPPFESMTMVGGGHDNRVYAEAGFAEKVVREFDMLDNKAENEKKWASPDNPYSGPSFSSWKKSKQQL